ncbi:hypothetical protein EYD10_17265, partial [Varanus komodoensis]
MGLFLPVTCFLAYLFTEPESFVAPIGSSAFTHLPGWTTTPTIPRQQKRAGGTRVVTQESYILGQGSATLNTQRAIWTHFPQKRNHWEQQNPFDMLAATGATKLLKREYLKVNIPQTCEEIMAFILVRVPPPVPGAPRPRFSLYLSAQLQYGVIRVYSRQCQYLVEDIQQILERLHRAQLQIRIDLTDLEQPGLLLPDQLVLMEALEEAPNPFFGVMEPVLPSPASIPHVRCSLAPSRICPPLLRPMAVGSQLPGTEQLIFCPFLLRPYQIRHLLEAPTPERSPVERSPPPPVPRRRAEEPLLTLPPEAITLKEMEPIIVLPIEGEKDLPEITVKEIEMLVEQEGFVAPGEERPLRVSPRKRRAEEEPAEEVREEEALETVLLPGKRLRTPAELLGGPTYGWMHPTLLGLWSRCASLQRVDYARRRVLEEEEIERAVEEVQKAEVPSELEELRAAEEGSVSRVGSSEISLEITEEELRPSLVAVEERIPLEPEEVALPVVPELPEISFELPLEKDAVTLDSVRRLVAAKLQEFGEMRLDTLVPLSTSRAVASR